jgi:hypothetical protein
MTETWAGHSKFAHIWGQKLQAQGEMAKERVCDVKSERPWEEPEEPNISGVGRELEGREEAGEGRGSWGTKLRPERRFPEERHNHLMSHSKG